MGSDIDPQQVLQTELEVKELEVEDLKAEVLSLKNIILSKNKDNARMRTSLKIEKKKLSSLQNMFESFSKAVRNTITPGQEHPAGTVTPSDSDASPWHGRCDTSSDMSVTSPLLPPSRPVHLPDPPAAFEFLLPHPTSEVHGQCAAHPQLQDQNVPVAQVQSAVSSQAQGQGPFSSDVLVSHQSSSSSQQPPPHDSYQVELPSKSSANKQCALQSSSTRKVLPPRSSSSNSIPGQLSAVQPQSHPTAKLTCPVCSKHFTNLNLHLTLRHKEKEKPPSCLPVVCKCSLCKRSVKRENLGKHMEKVHRKEISEPGTEYEVEQVISSYEEDSKVMYQVRWTIGDTTWEPELNLTNCKEKISQYWKQQSPVGSVEKQGRKIQVQVRCKERNSSGRRVPRVRMLVRETSSVRRVKTKYSRTLGVNYDQLQLFWKETLLEDQQLLTGLEGEILMAKVQGWG
eukprot:GFUD01035701.1.p1 GENE.GFUD01035701.1~~GFUD01035701.1.p1  ORF type:complete len:455 (+),score=115.94 GFUD01035701.1:96-1460(+)